MHFLKAPFILSISIVAGLFMPASGTFSQTGPVLSDPNSSSNSKIVLAQSAAKSSASSQEKGEDGLPELGENEAAIFLKTGKLIKLQKINYTYIECTADGFEFRTRLEKIKSFLAKKNGGGVSLVFYNDYKVAGQVEPFTIIGEWEFGKKTVTSDAIQKARFKTAPLKDNKPTGVSLTVTSKLKQRKVPGYVRGFTLGSFELEPDNRLIGNIEYSAEDKALVFTGTNSKKTAYKIQETTKLQGILSGDIDFNIPFAEIASISHKQIPGSKQAETTETPQVLAEITDSYGNVFPVYRFLNWYSLSDSDIFFPRTGFQSQWIKEKELVVFYDGPVRYLIKPEDLSRLNLMINDATIQAPIGADKIVSKKVAVARIRAESNLGEFSIAISGITKFKRISEVKKMPGFYAPANAQAEIVTATGDSLFVKDLIFNARNTLRPGWTATGRLYRHSANVIPVTLEGEDDVLLSFDKLKKLEVNQNYPKQKQVTFTSTNGNTISGKINLELITKSDDKTYLSDEGLLASISDSLYCFIPLEQIRYVNLMHK